jgi:hypothetical protein
MLMERADDWLKCPCCESNYTKEGERAPHILLCGHSICWKDIKQCNEQGRTSLPCPVCHHKIGLHLYKDHFPPRNYAITEQLDSLRSMIKDATSCQECQHNLCTLYCKDCKLDLCEDCNGSIHKLRVFSTHSRVPIDEKSRDPASQMFCSIHPSEPLRLFCMDDDCRVPSCFLCATHGQHKGHNLVLIDEAVPGQKETFAKVPLTACSTGRQSLQSIQTKLFTAEKTLLTNRQTFLDAVKDDFVLIRQALDQLETQILDYINHEASEQAKDIYSLQIELASRISEVAAIEFKGKMVLQADSTFFLSVVKEMTEKLLSRTTKAQESGSRTIVPSVGIQYKKDKSIEIIPGNKNSKKEIGLLAHTFLSAIRSFNILNIKVTTNDELIVTGFVELTAKTAYEFSAVTVKSGGILTVKGWDGSEHSGYLNLIVTGNLIVEEGGQINLTGRGYRGGASSNINERTSSDGESSYHCAGKGGKASNKFGSTGGGGGGFGTVGTDAEPNRYKDEVTPGGVGGQKMVGTGEKDSLLLRGSGGGKTIDCLFPEPFVTFFSLLGGGSGYSGSIGGHGGAGGGLLLIKAREIRNSGVICSDGAAGLNGEGIYSSGGGGGSGGCIKLAANIIHNSGEITTLGGGGGTPGAFNGCFGICCKGGAGGEGVILIELADDITGESKIVPKPITKWVN